VVNSGGEFDEWRLEGVVARKMHFQKENSSHVWSISLGPWSEMLGRTSSVCLQGLLLLPANGTTSKLDAWYIYYLDLLTYHIVANWAESNHRRWIAA
jgi:hypothetical protein